MEKNQEREKLLAEVEKKRLFPALGLEIMKWDEVSVQGFFLLWAIVLWFVSAVRLLAGLGAEKIPVGWCAAFILAAVLIVVFSLTTIRAVRRSRVR